MLIKSYCINYLSVHFVHYFVFRTIAVINLRINKLYDIIIILNNNLLLFYNFFRILRNTKTSLLFFT